MLLDVLDDVVLLHLIWREKPAEGRSVLVYQVAEHVGPRPLRLTDAQRRRLSVRGQRLGRRVFLTVP